jgi:hypothetical protein
MTPFDAFADDFLEITGRIVWCTATTVDEQCRPRSRILHPIFEVADGMPVGYVVTGRTPVKSRHLAVNPHVACSWWSQQQDVAYADCIARWVETAAEKAKVWRLFHDTPPPLGYALHYPGGFASPAFTPLRLDPWRVQVLRFHGWDDVTPRTWRRDPAG